MTVPIPRVLGVKAIAANRYSSSLPDSTVGR